MFKRKIGWGDDCLKKEELSYYLKYFRFYDGECYLITRHYRLISGCEILPGYTDEKNEQEIALEFAQQFAKHFPDRDVMYRPDDWLPLPEYEPPLTAEEEAKMWEEIKKRHAGENFNF